MSFLFVSEFEQNPDSGAAGSILAVADALRRRGHRVDCLWRDPGPYRLPHPRLRELFELPRRQCWRVAARLRVTDYDVVIVSQPFSYLIYERLPALYPNTVFLNRTHGWEHRVDAAQRRFPWVDQLSPHRRLLAAGAAEGRRRACARTARACHGLIAPSSFCTKFIERTYELSPRKIAVIPYGLDEIFRRGTRATIPINAPLRMLYVGQYRPWKGSNMLERYLPRLADEHPDATLTFVVQHEAIAHVRSHFQPAYGGRLSVLGWLPRDELADVYGRHDVLLFPTMFEGFGKTFLEAMGRGLCVVGYAEGGLPDIAVAEESALFCEPGNETGLLERLERCLRDPELARMIGVRARGVARRYSWDRVATETEQFCTAIKERVLGADAVNGSLAG